MDFRDHLIESTRTKGRSGWKAVTSSFALHATLIAGVVLASNQPTHTVHAEEKAIPAFVTQGAAPPPPPPPPPAPAGGADAPATEPQRPRVQPLKQSSFTPPREIPKSVPKVDPIPVTDVQPVLDLTPDPQQSSGAAVSSATSPEAAVTGGVPGGVPGGQVRGVLGGEVGGVVGGQIGGVVGGVIGGKVGGTVGGSGTGTEGEGSGGPEAPVAKAPEPPSGPLRVGGDVKAPVAVNRFNPEYTEAARSARISGVVIIEAIIDKNGNVDSVKVVKDLPMGLSDRAADAVRRWKFKPGTLNGEPVDTIFNLTVNFTMSD